MEKGTVPFSTFFIAGVFNNCCWCRAVSGEILYICKWWRLGCCIRLTPGSWLRNWAALRDFVMLAGLVTGGVDSIEVLMIIRALSFGLGASDSIRGVGIFVGNSG